MIYHFIGICLITSKKHGHRVSLGEPHLIGCIKSVTFQLESIEISVRCLQHSPLCVEYPHIPIASFILY
jgi:hypothetical protein